MKKIYIKTNSSKQQLDLVCKIVLFLGLKYFTIWFYPEVKKKKRKKLLTPFENSLYGKMMLKPITVYDEKQTLKKVKLFKVDNIEKCTFYQNLKALKGKIDSICFYNGKKPHWRLCGIMHENIIIAKYSKKLEKYLIREKIEYDKSPPDWW